MKITININYLDSISFEVAELDKNQVINLLEVLIDDIDISSELISCIKLEKDGNLDLFGIIPNDYFDENSHKIKIFYGKKLIEEIAFTNPRFDSSCDGFDEDHIGGWIINQRKPNENQKINFFIENKNIISVTLNLFDFNTC